MSLSPPPPDPCAEQIGYPLKNGEPEADGLLELALYGSSPGGVAVQVGFRRLVDCCHPTYSCTAAMSIVISRNSPLHNSLSTLSLGFILFFFHHLIAGLQKGPFSPMFPEISSSPWARFPLFFFHHHIYF